MRYLVWFKNSNTSYSTLNYRKCVLKRNRSFALISPIIYPYLNDTCSYQFSRPSTCHAPFPLWQLCIWLSPHINELTDIPHCFVILWHSLHYRCFAVVVSITPMPACLHYFRRPLAFQFSIFHFHIDFPVVLG